MTKSTVKYIQSLQQKKFRDEHGVFVAEGFKTIADLLKQKQLSCQRIFITEGHISEDEVVLLSGETIVERVTITEMEKISLLKTPPGVLGVFNKPGSDDPGRENGIILALDKISDPGNLGTIVRTADWFGIKHIVCQHGTADLFNPKVVQGTMASIGNVNVFYTDLETWLKNYPHTIYATALDGQSLSSFQPQKNAVIIIGNEAGGVRTSIEKLAKYRITIPGCGNAESLNAAIATGILLYHFRAI